MNDRAAKARGLENKKGKTIMADAVNVNIKQTAYTNAISKLEQYLNDLQSARDDYEAQERQIEQFWTGEAAESAKKTIQKSIEQVDKAAESVRQNLEAVKKGQSDASSIESGIQDEMNTAHNTISNLF